MATTLTTIKSASLSFLVSALILAGASEARSMQDHDHGKEAHATEETVKKKEFYGDPYLLSIDPVSGEALGAIESQVIIEHEGRELRFVGEKTAATFKAGPTKFLPAIDEKMIAQQLPYYPLEMCVISGEKLGGEMGEPINVIHKNRLVRLCCNGCKKSFSKDPAAQIDKINKAVAEKQGKPYPLTTCVVSGEKLGGMGDPIDYVFGNRLVRLCCKGCKKKVSSDPLAFLAKLHAADASDRGHGKDAHDGHGDHGNNDR